MDIDDVRRVVAHRKPPVPLAGPVAESLPACRSYAHPATEPAPPPTIETAVNPRTPTVRRCARLVRAVVPILALFASALAHAEKLVITLEGVEGELAEAARANLTLQNYVARDVTAAQVRRLFQRGEDEIRRALEPYGYYNVQVSSTLRTTDKGLDAVFRVTPGDPVIVRNSTVRVEGEGGEMRSVRAAVRRFQPKPGERLDHGRYEESKSAIESALFNTGYLRARAIAHRVEVTRQANTADIDLRFDSGQRHRFGEVRFSEAQFPQEFLERFIPWEPEQFYSPDEVLTFQQRLVDADYFATVSVQPNLREIENLQVPIDVTLTPAKRSVYTAGVYASTDTGPGVRGGLQRRWVNPQGHKFQVDVDYAQRLDELFMAYRIPLPGPDNRSLNFGASHRDEDTASTQSRTQRVTANETREWHGFLRTLGVQYLAGNFEVASEMRYSKLFYAEGTLSKKDANDFFFPRRGWSAALGLRGAMEGLLTDTSFAQITLDGKYIRPLGRRQRFITRLSLGAMTVDDFDELPPELRFFAGGDRSIRGFDYQQIGSTNDAGEVIGGTFLAVGSLEVERFFLERWGAALFVDGGDAFRTDEFNLNIGAGVGIRWRSPVGMVRVDVAKPVSSDLSDSIRFHISIGPDL